MTTMWTGWEILFSSAKPRRSARAVNQNCLDGRSQPRLHAQRAQPARQDGDIGGFQGTLRHDRSNGRTRPRPAGCHRAQRDRVSQWQHCHALGRESRLASDKLALARGTVELVFLAPATGTSACPLSTSVFIGSSSALIPQQQQCVNKSGRIDDMQGKTLQRAGFRVDNPRDMRLLVRRALTMQGCRRNTVGAPL